LRGYNLKYGENDVEVFGKLIYAPETASGEAISKVESHTPKIEAPDSVKIGQLFDLDLKVGPHPNTVEHSIRRINVYFSEEGRSFNPVHLATTEFTPVYTEPNARIRLKLNKSGTVYAVGYCNLHGLWEGRKQIKVTT
jgi:superoxide reductase